MLKTNRLHHYLFLIITALIGMTYTLVNFYPDAPILTVNNKTASIVTQTDLTKIITSEPALFKQAKIVEQADGKGAVITFPSVDAQMLARDYINTAFEKQYTASPNLMANYPSWLKYLGAAPMKLGLDLRGGVHLTLNVDVDNSALVKGQNSASDIIKKIRSQDIDYDSAKASNGQVVLNFESAEAAIAAANKINESQTITAKAEQATVKVTMDQQSNQHQRNYIMQRTLESIHKRVNELGLSEAVIQRQGDTQINIDLPGIQDMQRAKDIIGNTATLSFHIVKGFDAKQHPGGEVMLIKNKEGQELWLDKTSILSGDAITFAVATNEQAKPIIQIQLNGGSAEENFYTATAENTGNSLAIVYQESTTNPATQERSISKTVLSYPRIKQPLRGSFIIEGMRSQEEAETLALLLRSGSLAAPIDIVHETTVGPSLGEDNIQKGIFSIAVGFGVVVGFMTVYYRVFGIIANIGLLYNLVLIVTCLSLLDATMSLPAMAAIVLTVGMAVDANVLMSAYVKKFAIMHHH